MKVSLNWLKDYLNLDNYTTDELFDLISFHMTEIESAYKLCDATNLTIGHVLECVAHPDSDHLHVCQVEIKPGVVTQIVCGAPNVGKGEHVIVALPGAVLPGNFKIKESKVRGVESNGMICSLQELGVDDKYVEEAYKDGIYILEDDAPVGEDPLKYLGLDDFVFDLDLTSNRSDLLSVEGIAYDLGATLNQKVCTPIFKLKETKEENPVKVSVKTKKCTKYLTRYIKNVKIAESPDFIKSRLIASGIRPINNVVDITNYVLVCLGQPLHSFDADKLGNKIVVREALKDETITTLDNQERKLQEGDIVITNGKEALCVAGVMGGVSTQITSKTKNVVLEAAYFEPLSIRKTSQALQLKSESSTRFERTVDYQRINRALDFAAYLLNKYADGKVLKGINGIEKPFKNKVIKTSLSKINGVLGTSLTNEEVEQIFDRYAFDFESKNNNYKIIVPSRRMDLLESYQDINEDVARLYGYNNIPTTLPCTNDKGGLTPRQKMTRNIRLILSSMGLYEAVTYSLTSNDNLYSFVEEEKEPVEVLMPLTEDRKVMRQSLVPSLLDVISYNKARKLNDLAFFEIGKVYSKGCEEEYLAGAFNGMYESSLWQGFKKPVDFFTVKGILETLFEKLNLVVDFEAYAHKDMHPGRCAKLSLNGQYLGFVGEVHPRYAKDHDCKGSYVFELKMDVLFNSSKSEFKYQSICKFPTVQRDLAIVVDKNVTCKQVLDVIKMASKKKLANVEVFDLYEGENVGENEKSIAFTLTFQDYEKTLQAEDVDKIINSILNRLDAILHAHLR